MVRLGWALWGAVMWAAAAGAAQAQTPVSADKPVYAPPPAWVKPAPIPDRPAATDGSPIQTLLMDDQTFLGPDGDEQYAETAYRIVTPQGLGPSGSIVMTWRPDTEVLTIHKARIIRGGKVIDLLAGGKIFTVLRRETNLEMAMLDGALTATLQPEGLQVGDIVDLATTLTRRDPALQGFSEDYDRLGHQGVAARVRYRELWPDAKPIRWKAAEGLSAPTISHQDGQTELTVDMTDVTAPKPPVGAPGRFQQLGDLQVTQFTDWGQMSALMAPLYAKASTLAPDSPLRAEAARIAASTHDPKARAMAALKLVQEQVRYLFLGMDDGGYVPADADTTWTRRFGDCKAKTALLVALLKALGIDAQPAMVNADGADGLDQRLPMIRAFNHVIVRAVIGGKVYWLDGARTGDRTLDDIRTPPFDWALPVQASGAALARLERQPLAQPSVVSTLAIDASHGFDARATVHMRTAYSGEEGLAMRQEMAKLASADSQRSQREYWTKLFPWLEVSDVTSGFDEATGVMSLSMTGSGQMEWITSPDGERYYRVPSTTMGYDANFKREPGPNQDAPFLLPFPLYLQGVTTISLPAIDKGRFVVLGDDVDVALAGTQLTRTSRVDGLTLTITIGQRTLGREVAAAQARADAVQLRTMGQTGVTIVYNPLAGRPHAAASGAASAPPPPLPPPVPPPAMAPAPHRPETAFGQDVLGRGLEARDLDAALKAFDQAVALNPNDLNIRLDRARALLRKGQDAKALDDANHALALDAKSEAAHMLRGEIYAHAGHRAQAIDDFTAAVALAPRDPEPLKSRAEAYAVAHHYPLAVVDLTAAIALAPRRADLLEERSQAYRFQSNLAAAKADLDAAIALQPSAIAYFLRSSVHGPSDAAAARADLDTALRLQPGYGAALEARAQLALRTGDLAQAAKDYDLGLRTTADAAGFLEREAIAYEAAGQYAQAVSAFDALIARRPGQARDLSNRCWTKAVWGQQLKGALADCDAALALSPGDGTAMYDRGYAHLKLGQLDAAIDDFTAAVQAGPKVAAALYGRGVARRRKGQTTDGDGDLAAAKAINPQIAAEMARAGVVP